MIESCFKNITKYLEKKKGKEIFSCNLPPVSQSAVEDAWPEESVPPTAAAALVAAATALTRRTTTKATSTDTRKAMAKAA